MQPTLSDADGLGKLKQTRREIFLAEMKRMIPWAASTLDRNTNGCEVVQAT
ncbi:hypothetical protein [Xanthomonas oryzae]|uniref:hypothetical protein n=1 Tax=Xanthomonas oryzae TaxID=347 RepID=UPI00131ED889|nr:hypothetical protein [Xanthomonas oryzae]